MSKSKSDTQIFKLTNETTTAILNDLNIAPILAIRKLVTWRIELAIRQSNMNGFKEAHADMRRAIKTTGGKAK